MKYFILPLLVLSVSAKCSELVRVGIIDTGLSSFSNAPLCKDGHADFSKLYAKMNKVPVDNAGHGSHISDTINQRVKGKYCQVIIKFTDKGFSPSVNFTNSLKHALGLHLDILNLSTTGFDKNEYEITLIHAIIDSGTIVVAAAGNEGLNMDLYTPLHNGREFGIYPAMDDPRIIVVGSLNVFYNKAAYSNYGKFVTVWEMGTSIIAKGKDGKPLMLTGTSQATAIHTARLINKLIKEKEKRNAVQKIHN